MGAFFVARHGQNANTRRKTLALHAFGKQGYKRIVDLSTGDFDILYCGKHNVDSDSLYRVDERNFCFSTGTLIYRRRIGNQAARLAFEDFSRQALDTEQLFGNFALVVCIEGRLHIHNDAQGVYAIWHDNVLGCLSSSFPVMFTCLPHLSVNPDAVYPYVFQEATFGGDTVFREIQRLRVGEGVLLQVRSERVAGLASSVPRSDSTDIDRHVRTLHELLREQFAAIAACFGDNIGSALSGGYDSRLLLALCREQGLSPHLHVYGRADAADVRVAKAVCAGEGLVLSHEDKAQREKVTPNRFADIIKQNFYAFQGLCADGILDSGADLQTRLGRSLDGRLLLNGGGGEVMRNFFYLPDRSYSIRELLWSFYSRFNPGVCTDLFSEESYYSNFERQITRQFGGNGHLDRATVEHFYAGFRCSYWMGQNNAINNQFGWFLTPFVEWRVAQYAHGVPLILKNHGRLEGALIKAVSPALATYPSSYGHDFSGHIPLKRRVSDRLTLLRPPWLRRYIYRWKTYRCSDWPYYLDRSYIRAILPDGFEYLLRYFNIDKVTDAAQYRRICSLEYLLQKTNASTEPNRSVLY